MGKKHKKHKSDKHLYEEYVEKPLKLVLKVGGNEVTELSTGSSGHDSSLFEDRNDHDKHKDRKRKKRKKGEKQASGEEKGRKRRRVKCPVRPWKLQMAWESPACSMEEQGRKDGEPPVSWDGLILTLLRTWSLARFSDSLVSS
ncbi:bromodomain-containing protein 7-like isoform X2 [Dipodomys merriami]|uniref:bromodomain-containing protein 7-like isoform X2 n=1 Tax=Dipodomys merriami TaxID=94247 RepID=UPI003855D490